MIQRCLQESEQYMTPLRVPRALIPVLLIPLAILAACSREADDWRAAQAADTVASYERFVRDHPASARVTEARRRAAQLAEEEDWRRAQEEDSLQAYQIFVSQHPESRFAPEARLRIETIQLGGLQRERPLLEEPPAAPAPTVAAPAAPAVQPPPSAPSATTASAPRPAPAPATAPAATTGGWGIQLGAFSSEAAARAQWQTLSSRHAAQLGGRGPRVVGATTANGRVYRLQTAVRDEAEARRLCVALSAASQPCVVVPP